MNQQNDEGSTRNDLLDKLSEIAVPVDVEQRLQGLMTDFYRKLESAPPISIPKPKAVLLPVFRRTIRAYAAAGLVAGLVVYMLTIVMGSRDAWAEVTKSLSEKPWVRLTFKITEGLQVPEGFEPPTIWYSAEKKIAARRHMKSAEFIDLARQEIFCTMPGGTTLWHSNTSNDDHSAFAKLEHLLRLVASEDLQLKRSDSPIEIVDRSRHEIQDGERRLIEFRFTCRDPQQTPSDYETTIRIDPQTKLPVEMCSNEKFPRDPDGPGTLFTYTFDYPTNGPEDIFDLGVPRTVEVLDRRRSITKLPNEISEFLAEYEKAQKTPFEPFSVFTLGTTRGPKIPCVLYAYRCRVGENDSQDEVPEHQKMFYPRAVGGFESVGQQQLLEMMQAIWSKEIRVPEEMRIRWLKEKVSTLPFASAPRGQWMLPHDAGYPKELNTYLDWLKKPRPMDDAKVEFTLDKLPQSGPKGTVLLKIVVKTSVGFSDLRFWISPAHDYLVLRQELTNSRGHEPWSVSTTTIQKLDQSPKGRWYATEVWHGTVEQSGDELTDDEVRIEPSASGNIDRLRIVKAGRQPGDSDIVFDVQRNADGSENNHRPTSTTKFHFFVEFQ